jgi:flagellar biosynthesis/type III secretory pathway chaperone
MQNLLKLEQVIYTEVQVVNKDTSHGSEMDTAARNKIGLLLQLGHFVEQCRMFNVQAHWRHFWANWLI